MTTPPRLALVLLLLFNTTRTTSGPPSTGATIAMDGGVAVLLLLFNTTRAHTPSLPPAAVQHNAHTLRTPKHEGLNRYGRRCGRHNMLLQCCCCSTQRAHSRTRSGPKHEGLYRSQLHPSSSASQLQKPATCLAIVSVKCEWRRNSRT